MKGRAKVLDSRFIKFVENLQKIGELQNTVRMIDSLAEMKNVEYGDLNIESNKKNNSGIDLLLPFWQNGWIEIRETDRRGKNWHIKEYALLFRLKEIAAYFEQKKHQRIRSSAYTMSEQNARITA